MIRQQFTGNTFKNKFQSTFQCFTVHYYLYLTFCHPHVAPFIGYCLSAFKLKVLAIFFNVFFKFKYSPRVSGKCFHVMEMKVCASSRVKVFWCETV